MTKDQILDECAAPYSCQHIGRYRDSALTAMQKYADQENGIYRVRTQEKKLI